jgi:2-amino-4-hydroxy-6-hydroxymethyldihydropteridine diphosphokinase
MSSRVFLSIGSNLGDRLGFLQQGIDALAGAAGITIVAISSVYETDPVGNKNQPVFLNAAVELRCSLTAGDLVALLKQTERTIGRSAAERWGPREIDLDLIYFGDLITDQPGVHVPHPEAERRRFVLQPIAELAPAFLDPNRSCTVGDLLRQCGDSSAVVKITSTLQPPDPER